MPSVQSCLTELAMTSVAQEIASLQKAIDKLTGKCDDLAKDCKSLLVIQFLDDFR